MSIITVRRVAYGAGLAVLIAVIVFTGARLDLPRLWSTLRTVRAPWLLGVIVAYAAILPLWALQWRLLAPASPRNDFRHMLGVIAMASTLYNSSLTLMGEAASIVLLVTRIGMSRSAALSVLAMDQLIVGLAKLLLLLLATTLIVLPSWMATGIETLAGGVGILLVACMAGAWQYARIARTLEGILPPRVSAAVRDVGQALAPLRSPSRAGAAIAIALAKKASEIAAIICVQRAFGVALPVADAVLLLAAVSVLTLLAVMPGNLGVYEGTIVLVYRHLGIDTELAVGMAIVQHAFYLAILGLPGLAWFARAGASPRQLANGTVTD